MSLFSFSRPQTHHVKKPLNLYNNCCCDPGYTYIAQISQRGQQVTVTGCRQHDENLSSVSHNTCPSSLTCCTRPPRPRSASPTSPTPCPGDHSISGLVMILFPVTPGGPATSQSASRSGRSSEQKLCSLSKLGINPTPLVLAELVFVQ